MNEIDLPAQRSGQDAWDKKKILIFLVLIVIVLALGFNTLVLGQKDVGKTEVKGTTTKEQSSQSQNIKEKDALFSKQNLQKTFEDKVNEIKSDVNNINVVDVATSTPAIQKVINDIKNLQNYPQSQAKDVCLKICSAL